MTSHPCRGPEPHVLDKLLYFPAFALSQRAFCGHLRPGAALFFFCVTGLPTLRASVPPANSVRAQAAGSRLQELAMSQRPNEHMQSWIIKSALCEQ
jgi:hypothetical protein